MYACVHVRTLVPIGRMRPPVERSATGPKPPALSVVLARLLPTLKISILRSEAALTSEQLRAAWEAFGSVVTTVRAHPPVVPIPTAFEREGRHPCALSPGQSPGG